MSRGPGRIEQAIEATFTRFPDQTFSTAELGLIVYPGIDRLEKKHRVSIVRAADKVAKRIAWSARRARAPAGAGGVVYYNLMNARSYRLGMLRAGIFSRSEPLRELEERLDNPDARNSEWSDIQPGGVWALHVEIHKDLARNLAEGERLRREELRRAPKTRCVRHTASLRPRARVGRSPWRCHPDNEGCG
jgi:hypothetical protein